MTRKHTPSPGGHTPADELRADLAQCEKWVAQIGDQGSVSSGSANNGMLVLRTLDRVADGLDRLGGRGADVRAERVRFENVLSELRRRDKVFVSHVGAALAAQRPLGAQWWWYLDEHVAANRRRRAKRVIGVALAALAFLVVLYVIYDRFLAAPPHVRQAHSHVFQGEQIASKGDLAAAIEEFEQAAALDPQQAGAHLWLGVLYQMTGRADQGAAAFERAQALFADRVAFLFQRGTLYLTLNDADAAAKDAQSLIKLIPDGPEGYFLLGNVAAKNGDLDVAQEAFQKAADLAAKTGQAEMEVTARIRLGDVLQQLAVPRE